MPDEKVPTKGRRPTQRPTRARRNADPATPTADWADAYIAALAIDGRIHKSAATAGVDPTTVQRRRKADAEFARRETEALDVASDGWEQEAIRRATEGTTRDVIYKGMIVGQERTFSDTILLRLLETRRAHWRPKQTIELKEGATMTRAERKAALEKARAEEAAAHGRS